MSKEEPKSLSVDERERLNAALAMSELASGLSPVKVMEKEMTANRQSHSCSQRRDLPANNMESTSKFTTKNSLSSRQQNQDAQTEPLDLSSPNLPSKSQTEELDSGNESNNSPEPVERTTHKNKDSLSTFTILNPEGSFIKVPHAHPKAGIIRPHNLGLKTVASLNLTNSKVTVSPVKSESELDSPASNSQTFAQWTAPFKPSLTRPSSDCQSYSSSTSGYSSESFSEAQSEIESPGPERLRSNLPPKKRKHIRHARNWEVETKKKVSPSPGTSTPNEDDEVFTPSESPGKIDAGPKQVRVVVRPTPKNHGDKPIRINPKLIQEIRLAVTPDEEGDLPLHIAVVQENKDVIARVIPLMKVAGLSIDTPNALRQTPLHLAVITGEAEIVSYLIRQGAAANFCDREGNTSLHLAVKHNQIECLKVMLQDPTKIDINSKNFEGMTPLHVAVQEKSLEVTKCLLDNGADIDCQDGKSGRTALHHAVEVTSTALVAELLKRNANVNQPSYSGCSPLHVASGRGHLDIVQLLVQYGADTTMRNFSVSVDSHQAAVQSTPGASGSTKSPPSGQKRNQKASVKRKIREKLNT